MLIRSRSLAAIQGLSHGLSTTTYGALGGDEPASHRRRVELARTLGASEVDGTVAFVVPHQVHGRVVQRVSMADAGRGHPSRAAVPSTDGLVTTERGLALLVQGADCPLLLLHDPEAGVLGVAHSGWRGTVAGIGSELVREMVAAGASVSSVRAAVFPGICGACFEIGPEVVAAFRASFGRAVDSWVRPSPRRGGDHALLDLGAAIRETLARAGVTPDRVETVEGCTYTDARLFSHRASGGEPGRHALVAVQRPA